MFIRRTKTRTTEDGTQYFSYRLVRNERQGDRVRQRTLLNLGSHFPVEKRHWRLLCARITQLIGRQETLLPLPWPDEVEAEAQRIAARLVSRSPPVAGAGPGSTLETVDVASLEMVRPRSAGVEHVGLWAMEQLGLEELLEHLGFNRRSRAVAMGSIIGRMAVPGSERATWRWLCERSALGELLDVDFETMSRMRLYRASDALLSRRREIETHMFARVTDLFSLGHTVTLFDLTNTFFEGAADGQPKARRGHSKEKRSDCPLLTLGLVLDGSGFVQRSDVFPGNVQESGTLEAMLARLTAPRDALVVMDAGVATEDNVTWLRDNGYRYLVVSRERVRRFDPDLATAIETRSRGKVHIQAVTDEAASELRLFCCSEARAEKELGITERFMTRFEDALQELHDGLSRPRTRKQVAYVWQRIGRIRQRSRGAGQHYSIDIVTDPENAERAVGLIWTRTPRTGTMLTHPGVYRLRTNQLDWDAETLWRTYSMLTDVESVFRSLKSELGLRPVYHRKQVRSDGHLFISVLAYQLVQVIRSRLRAHGETASWSTLRDILSGQIRVTACFRRADGRVIHIRRATRAEPRQRKIYGALGLDPEPGKMRRMVA